MATLEKEEGPSTSNPAPSMAVVEETDDAHMSQILDTVSMATATTSEPTESVISESANVVVQRLSAGSPTWTLTATDRGIAEEVSCMDYFLLGMLKKIFGRQDK